MAVLTGDPANAAISWAVTDVGSGFIRVRRRALSGTAYHISDTFYGTSEKECANLVAQTMADAEGGTATLLP